MTQLISTRDDKAKTASFEEAMLNPSAILGGLYTFKTLPKLSQNDIKSLCHLSYENLCIELFKKLDLGINEDTLRNALQSYQNFDEANNPAPINTLDSKLFLLELYHGPTRAFKDMALQPFSRLFSHYASTRKIPYLILTATSGDTGPATLHSFANTPFINVACIYPHGGTSEVQERQMCGHTQPNCKVIGIHGDFDDAQNTLKTLLCDDDFIHTLRNKGIALSAANSVNIGRIVFQIVYYFWAYLQLLHNNAISSDEELSVIVPSGNFGNILGAFFAKAMGLKLGKLIVASNSNNILCDFIQSGVYDISKRTLLKTKSPAMDILKSSNVERVLYALYGSERTYELMKELELYGKYTLKAHELTMLQENFDAYYCDDKSCLNSIKEASLNGILLDPHTAIGYHVAKQVRTIKPQTPLLCVATAEWSKFAPSMKEALLDSSSLDSKLQKSLSNAHSDEQIIQSICESIPHATIPTHILKLFSQTQQSSTLLQPHEVKNCILQWLTDSVRD